MTSSSALRAARSIPAARLLGGALVLAGIAVLLVVGLWASRLGSPPSWAFDCNDTTCTDLWAVARRHYLRVAAVAGAAVLLGAVLCALTVPRAPVPRGGPRRMLLTLIPVQLLAAAMLWGAGALALSFSRPTGLALALLALLLAAGAAWRWMLPGAESERVACLLAGAGIVLPFAVIAVLAMHPMGFLVGVVILGHPLLGVPLLGGILLGGTAVLGTLVPRTNEEIPAPPAPPAHAPDAPAGRRCPARVATALALALITGVAVLGALPVAAPSADAWRYGTADTRAPDADATEPGPDASGAGATGSQDPAGGTGAERPTDPAVAPPPALDATDLPACTEASLQVVVDGWDHLMGDSAATLRATHTGTAPCALHGTPSLALRQGGEEIALRPEPLSHLSPAEPAPDGIGLAPGDSARSRLYWPGYRTAADQRTPQTLTLQIEGLERPLPVELAADAYGDDPGPAPFDLKAGVGGGAVIEVGPWEPEPTSAG